MVLSQVDLTNPKKGRYLALQGLYNVLVPTFVAPKYVNSFDRAPSYKIKNAVICDNLMTLFTKIHIHTLIITIAKSKVAAIWLYIYIGIQTNNLTVTENKSLSYV